MILFCIVRKKDTIWNLEQKVLGRCCFHTAECYYESKQARGGVFFSARASISASLSISPSHAHRLRRPLLSRACSLWRRGSQVVCQGRRRRRRRSVGGRACVAIETPRYQLYQPLCLTQIFFFFSAIPRLTTSVLAPPPAPFPHTDSVMVPPSPINSPHPAVSRSEPLKSLSLKGDSAIWLML